MGNDRTLEDRVRSLNITRLYRVCADPKQGDWEYVDCILHAWELTDHEAITVLSHLLMRNVEVPLYILARLITRVRL